jgi:hypothetical protein
VTGVQVDRVVPASGNLSIGGQQIWLGPDRAGRIVTLRIDTARLEVWLGAARVKTCASRISTRHLAQLRAQGGRPVTLAAPVTGPGQAVEVDRVLGAEGVVSLGNQVFTTGASRFAGQRITLRLDGALMQVITAGGVLVKTKPCPLDWAACQRLRGARPAVLTPTAPAGPVTVERVVGSQGSFQVANQRVQVGHSHAHTVVTVVVDQTSITVLDGDTPLLTTGRTTREEVITHKAKQNHASHKIV